MAAIKTGFLITLLLYIYVISASCANLTAEVTEPTPPREYKPSGALASFGRMLVDLPLGLVEAFKDGAEAIESVVLGMMHTIFT